METNSNMLKKALDRRKETNLSANFTFKMMEQIYIETAKHRRRKQICFIILFASAILFLIALAVFVLAYVVDFSFSYYVAKLQFWKPSDDIVQFYNYIGFLVFILLGLDYLLRSICKRRKT